MSVIAQTVKHLDKAFTPSIQAFCFRGVEGAALIGANDYRWWEFWGDRFLAIHLMNGKIMHLSFPTEKERDDQMMSAREWWFK
jgi:hypothetical protein